jgi:DMSO reductase anchor subunit
MSAHAGHRPLVVFTSLAIAGAGLVSASAYFELVHGLVSPSALAAGAVLTAAGLAVSLGHLGQKRRAALAVRGAGRSALSNEALFAGFALAVAAIVAVMGLSGSRAPVLTAAAGAVNAAFLVSIGLVYRVRGQRTWQGFSAATPLTGGLAFGAIAVQTTAGSGDVYLGTLLFIAIDALLFSQRWRDIVGIAFSERMLADPWHARRTQLLAARCFLLNVIPFFLLAASPTPLAIPVAAAGLLVDRFSFYVLALQHTTEHEIAGVEAQIDALGRTPED